MFQISENSN